MKRVIRGLKRLGQHIELRLNKSGNRHKCYICKNTFRNFYPYKGGRKSASSFIRTLDTIGSDTDNFSCPHCWCHDRERHLFMYFDRLALWSEVKGRVLQFAPEKHLQRAIEELGPQEYVKADLFPGSEELKKVDVTSIDYPDGYFDFVICNHVLEHVPDAGQAMKELYRVLKKGKYAVLQTPFSSVLSGTFEDENINTDHLRKQFYGQEDHVRVFGSDLFSKLEAVGFQLHLKQHGSELSDLDNKYYGVNFREPLILASKPREAAFAGGS